MAHPRWVRYSQSRHRDPRVRRVPVSITRRMVLLATLCCTLLSFAPGAAHASALVVKDRWNYTATFPDIQKTCLKGLWIETWDARGHLNNTYDAATGALKESVLSQVAKETLVPEGLPNHRPTYTGSFTIGGDKTTGDVGGTVTFGFQLDERLLGSDGSHVQVHEHAIAVFTLNPDGSIGAIHVTFDRDSCSTS